MTDKLESGGTTVRGLPCGETVFDYIIVGAGTAGCVLANRLSSDKGTKVLLLEAGPMDSKLWIHIPLGYGKTMFDPKINWCSSSANIEGLNFRSVYCPRGKCLGGSSSINGMLYVRGQPEDYDDWAKMGAKGWGWVDVRRYFMRLEDHYLGENGTHGRNGPVHVSEIRSKHRLADAFIESAVRLGIPQNGDFNGDVQEGVGYYDVTIKHGRRVSAATAYLRPIRRRSNVEIITNAIVERINCAGRVAKSVSYKKGGRLHVACADREIIVSCGAIGSPQLLQLSGIGPSDLLKEQGIEVVNHLQGVGENFHDHLRIRLLYRCREPISTNDDINRRIRRIKMGLEYVLNRAGPIATGINQAGAFMRSAATSSRPDIQVTFGTMSGDVQGGSVHAFSGFTVVPLVLRPRSRGFVRVKSKDASKQPVIQPNYLADDADLTLLRSGARLARSIVSTEPLSALVAEEHVPGLACESDDEWESFIRDAADGTIVGHPCGSCRMGEDKNAVVDSELRVYGVEALRVVDASVMPNITSGNTMAPTLMIGEKGSDLILGNANG